MSDETKAIIDAITSNSNHWNGLASVIISAGASIFGAVSAAIITFQLLKVSQKMSLINDAYLNLSKAVEQFKVAIIMDHLQLCQFKEGSHGEYQNAVMNIQIAMMVLVYTVKGDIGSLGEKINNYQKEMNRLLNEVLEENMALSSTRARSEAGDLYTIRLEKHATAENEINGLTAGLQNKLNNFRKEEISKVAKWWQFWK